MVEKTRADGWYWFDFLRQLRERNVDAPTGAAAWSAFYRCREARESGVPVEVFADQFLKERI